MLRLFPSVAFTTYYGPGHEVSTQIGVLRRLMLYHQRTKGLMTGEIIT